MKLCWRMGHSQFLCYAVVGLPVPPELAQTVQEQAQPGKCEFLPDVSYGYDMIVTSTRTYLCETHAKIDISDLWFEVADVVPVVLDSSKQRMKTDLADIISPEYVEANYGIYLVTDIRDVE